MLAVSNISDSQGLKCDYCINNFRNFVLILCKMLKMHTATLIRNTRSADEILPVSKVEFVLMNLI